MTVDPRSLVPQPEEEPTGTNEELEQIEEQRGERHDPGSGETGRNRELRERAEQEGERRDGS